VSEDPRFSRPLTLDCFHTISVLAVPLECGPNYRRARIVNKLEGEFDAYDLALVETLAGSAAIAIENARLVETLRRQAGELELATKNWGAFAHTVAHDLKSPLGNRHRLCGRVGARMAACPTTICSKPCATLRGARTR